MTREAELRKGCGKAVLNLNGVIVNYCGKLVREDNSLGNPDLCPTCQAKLEILIETNSKWEKKSQDFLKELKDRFNDWQNKLAVIDNTSKIIKFRNWIDHNEIIDTTFKQNFGELAE